MIRTVLLAKSNTPAKTRYHTLKHSIKCITGYRKRKRKSCTWCKIWVSKAIRRIYSSNSRQTNCVKSKNSICKIHPHFRFCGYVFFHTKDRRIYSVKNVHTPSDAAWFKLCLSQAISGGGGDIPECSPGTLNCMGKFIIEHEKGMFYKDMYIGLYSQDAPKKWDGKVPDCVKLFDS